MTVQYKGSATADTNSIPSESIWADCPWALIQETGNGYTFWDDFIAGGLTPTITTTVGVPPYTMFGSSGATVTYAGDVRGGAIVLTEATDNEAVNIVTESLPFQISENLGKLWFEARIKVSTITTNEQAWFVGLAGAMTQSATVPLTAAGALADINLVGFHKPEANTTAFDASYKADGVTAVEVNSDIGTLAVDTFVKLGMVFDPDDSNKLKFYINGVEQASTKTIPDDTGTDFPADVQLGLCVAKVMANSAEETLTMDWWRCAQLRTA